MHRDFPTFLRASIFFPFNFSSLIFFLLLFSSLLFSSLALPISSFHLSIFLPSIICIHILFVAKRASKTDAITTVFWMSWIYAVVRPRCAAARQPKGGQTCFQMAQLQNSNIQKGVRPCPRFSKDGRHLEKKRRMSFPFAGVWAAWRGAQKKCRFQQFTLFKSTANKPHNNKVTPWPAACGPQA